MAPFERYGGERAQGTKRTTATNLDAFCFRLSGQLDVCRIARVKRAHTIERQMLDTIRCFNQMTRKYIQPLLDKVHLRLLKLVVAELRKVIEEAKVGP